jgi:hypothetical protein
VENWHWSKLFFFIPHSFWGSTQAAALNFIKYQVVAPEYINDAYIKHLEK